jgi:S1-C subfamily serine protease
MTRRIATSSSGCPTDTGRTLCGSKWSLRVSGFLLLFSLVVHVPAVTAQSTRDVTRSARSVSEAELLLTIGQYRRALSAFEQLRANDSTAAVALLGMGRSQEGLGKLDEAVRSYQAYTKLAPNDASGHELLGRVLQESRRQTDALQSFETALRIDPGSAEAALGAAAALRSLGRTEEALGVLRGTVRHDPRNSTVWGALAQMSSALDRDVESIAYWREALRFDPSYFEERPGERAVWDSLTKVVESQAVPAAVVGSSEGGLSAARAESTARALPNDSSGVVVASPSYPRFARAARSSAYVPGPTSSGSGFVVSREGGFVLTNKHVVRGCAQVKVRVDGGKPRSAVVQAFDPDDDLALLRVALPNGPSATFREDPAVRPGDDVVAVGYPLAGLLADQVNVSTGTVNALAGLYNDLHLLQMSTPVQPGSSGGALFDASGHVVGVVVTKLNARVVAEETGDIPQNVNFAVKASVAREFLRQQGVAFRTSPSTTPRSNADVGDVGRQVTILVECWP